MEFVSPSVLHLVRAAKQMSPEMLAALRDELDPIKLMLTVPVLNERSVIQAQSLSTATDYLLLDSAHPQSGRVGATGLVHDWALSRRIAESCAALSVLAGGLGPANVREAIEAVRPLELTPRLRPVGMTTADARIPRGCGFSLNGPGPQT